MKALVNKKNKKVIGLNRIKNSLEIEIELLDLNITKEINGTQYSLINHPNLFTIDDLIEAKGKQILSKMMRKYIILNEELIEQDISLNLSSHSANTGYKFLQLRPNGQCRTNKIVLPVKTSSAGLYIECDTEITIEIGTTATNFTPIKNGEFINFSEETSLLYLRFKNNSNKYKQIYSYGIIF